MKKVMVILCMALTLAIQVNGQDRNQQPVEPNEEIKVQRETDEHVNVMKFDSTHSWSWSSEGSFPEELKEQLKKFNQSFESMHQQFDFEFIFPEDLATRFNHDLQYRIDSALEGRIKGLIFDFDGHAEHFEKLEQSIKDLFNDEANRLLWKDFREEHIKKLEELDFEDFTPRKERKEAMTL